MFSVEECYERHSEHLYKFIYLLTLNETLAEGLVPLTIFVYTLNLFILFYN